MLFFIDIILITLNIFILFVIHNKCHIILDCNKYYLVSLEKQMWQNYVVSFISNTIIGISSTINILTRTHNLNEITQFDKCIYIYCISYFMYDTYLINFKIKYNNAMEYNLHHAIVLYAIIYTIIYNIYSGYLVWFLTTELSSIFLNIKWFLYKSNYSNNSREYIITYTLLCFTYTIFRIIQLPYAEYKFIINYDKSINNLLYFYKQITIFSLMYGLNLYWYYIIIKKFIKNIYNYKLLKR